MTGHIKRGGTVVSSVDVIAVYYHIIRLCLIKNWAAIKDALWLPLGEEPPSLVLARTPYF